MIEIIGTIGMEATAQSVRSGLEASGDTVELYIDSPGGDVIESNAISLAISEHALQHPEKAYICTLGSLVASAAANIVAKLPTCYKIRAYRDTLVMYHSCSGIVEGTPDQLRDYGLMMQLVNEAVIRELSSRTTLGMEVIRQAFGAGRELWLDGERALEVGLVSELLDAAPEQRVYSTYASTRKVLELVAQYRKQHHPEANMAEEEKKEEMVETPPAAEVTTEEPVAEETELEKEEIAEEVKEEKEEAPEVDWEAECTKLRQQCDDLQKEVDALKALVAKYQPSATPAAQKPAKADWLTMVRELNAKHLPEQEYAREYCKLKAEHKPEFEAFMDAHSKR